MKEFDHIETATIEQDIQDTKKEVADFRAELEALRPRPQENRLRIYMAEGKVQKRLEFIAKLEKILEYRKQEGQL